MLKSNFILFRFQQIVLLTPSNFWRWSLISLFLIVAGLLFKQIGNPLSHQIIFIEPPIEAHHHLTQGTVGNVEIVILDPEQDGISQVLAARRNLAAYPAVLPRPNLDTSGSPSLPPLDQGDPPGEGLSLVELIGTTITDTTSGAVEGIAVTGSSGNGTWQYSLDGNSWSNFGPVSDSNATVLRVLYPLYDGLAEGSPLSQGWVARDFTSGAMETVGPNSTTLSTTDNYNLRDGYSSHIPNIFNPGSDPLTVSANYPVLDPAVGYTLRFELKLNSEDHASGSADKNNDNVADRAGLNLISVSREISKAIEIAFWEDEIWAQEDGLAEPNAGNGFTGTLFTHAEGVTYNTTQTTLYDLVIQGNTYKLYANEVLILSGSLRDYTPWDGSSAPFDVYETPSYIFLGDDTTSAKANFSLTHLEILDKGRIRFAPAATFSGEATLSYRATNKNSPGATGLNATGSEYSIATETASITINAADVPPSFFVYLPTILR